MSPRKYIVLAIAFVALAGLGVTAAFADEGHGKDHHHKGTTTSSQSTTSAQATTSSQTTTSSTSKNTKSNNSSSSNQCDHSSSKSDGKSDDDDQQCQSSSNSQKVCGLDVEWLKTSAEGDIFEIQGGQLALKKSSNPAVIKLAQTLISDHTQSLHETQQVASKLGISLPTDPSPTEKWELEEVSEMSGATFNHDYSELEVLDHMQDIQETQDEVDMGCNPMVRDLAKSDIPMLQKHLQLAQQALQASGPEPHNSTSQSQSGSDDNGG